MMKAVLFQTDEAFATEGTETERGFEYRTDRYYFKTEDERKFVLNYKKFLFSEDYDAITGNKGKTSYYTKISMNNEVFDLKVPDGSPFFILAASESGKKEIATQPLDTKDAAHFILS